MFEIKYGNGQAPEYYRTLAECMRRVEEQWPEFDAYYRDSGKYHTFHDSIPEHKGDLLIWKSEDDSFDDDGSRAVASISEVARG